MDAQTFIVIICVLLGGAAWYSQNSLRNKILCTFRRANRTRIEKFVKEKARYVYFDGGEYVVDTSKIQLTWYNRSINAVFPTFVPTLDFTWGSRYPLDPDTMEVTWYSPEASKALTQERNIRELDKAAQAATGKKEGGLTKYLPWITLAILLVLAMWIYQMSGKVAMMSELMQVK